MKTNKQKSQNLRRYAPLIVIGGILLFLAVVFLIASMFILPNRTDEPADTTSRPGSTPQTGEIVFRNDGYLSFKSPGGDEIIKISIEIADNEEARTQGLMGRTRMGEKQGMLFIFPNEEYRSFWMANTPLPLDIIYVNSARNIVTVCRNTVPFSEESVPSSAPATYVIEVNAGFCDRHGILEGSTVEWTRGAS